MGCASTPDEDGDRPLAPEPARGAEFSMPTMKRSRWLAASWFLSFAPQAAGLRGASVKE